MYGHINMRARIQDERGPRERAPETAAALPSAALSVLRVQSLQRTLGNRATTNLIQRMSVVDAVKEAKGRGAPEQDEELTRLATEGQRWDPNGKVWVTPKREDLWDQFFSQLTSLPKFPVKYTIWEAAQLKKEGTALEGKKGLDIDDDNALKALWGASSVFDKWERAAAIEKQFKDAGFEVQTPAESAPEKTSSKTPPVLFNIIGHKVIVSFEIHPGGGIHKGAYIRIKSQRGTIKVISSSATPAYLPLEEKDVKYVDYG
jgi:hypothetical protein